MRARVCRTGAAVVAVVAGLAAAASRDGLDQLPVRRGAGEPAVPLARVLGHAPALVAFWATWCAPCEAEVPVLRRAARRWGARGLRVVGVAVDDDAERVARAAADWGIDYDVFSVPREERARLAQLLPDGLPVTFVVGPRGVERLDRALSDADLERVVPPLLAPQPAS